MFKIKSFNMLTAIATALLLNSCTGQEIKKNENGLQYKILKDVAGKNAAYGDILELNLIIKTNKDSLLQTTFGKKPITFALQQGAFKGCLEEGLLLMSAGDSAAFFVSIDSMFNPKMGMQMPPFLKPNTLLHYVVKLEKVTSREAFEKEAKEQAEKRKTSDDNTIAKYLADNKIKATKSAGGLYYAVAKAGAGAKPLPGDTVAVHYTGKLLDGKVFDSSISRGEPIEFPLGMGFVIPGWDQGIALMAPGEKGQLFIPSHLAYGERDMGTIPSNSILIFDVELVKVKKGKK